MPTTKRRIPVIEDGELTAAITGARLWLGHDCSKAAVVRELALRGWRELESDDEHYRRAADELIAILDEGILDFAASEADRRRDPATK